MFIIKNIFSYNGGRRHRTGLSSFYISWLKTLGALIKVKLVSTKTTVSKILYLIYQKGVTMRIKIVVACQFITVCHIHQIPDLCFFGGG